MAAEVFSIQSRTASGLARPAAMPKFFFEPAPPCAHSHADSFFGPDATARLSREQEFSHRGLRRHREGRQRSADESRWSETFLYLSVSSETSVAKTQFFSAPSAQALAPFPFSNAFFHSGRGIVNNSPQPKPGPARWAGARPERNAAFEPIPRWPFSLAGRRKSLGGDRRAAIMGR
jgi:hypothetical protein